MLALNYVKNNLRAGGFAQAVLAYLADCMNEADGKCFPSRETIAEYFSSEDDPCTVKRVDRALARLRELGFIKSECVPHRKQAAKGIEGGWHNEYSFPGLSGAAPKTDATHRNGVDPMAGVSPTVERGSPQIGQGVAPTVERGSPHRGVEKQKETEVKQKRNSSSAHTCEEPPFDDELFNEAARVASESLESEVNVEVVCSAIGQTPYESISKQRTTQFNSVFGDGTPSEAQDAVTRKSEACSKPKQPRKERTPRVRFPEDIPEDWRVDAQKLRPEIDAQATFTKMRCWLGANNTTTKTMRQWKTQFLGWIGREKKGFGHYAGNHRADRPHQGYAGFGARNTAEIDYTAGID